MNNEKFCLRWNDFGNNVSSAFRELRDDKDFFDVTLACDDDQIQAHKVILSACSPFFRNILRRNPHQNPLLYLKGVRFTDLKSVLNFIYNGEVNVAQEELNTFLSVAEDLRIKGLTQSPSDTDASKQKETTISRPKSPVRDKQSSIHSRIRTPQPVTAKAPSRQVPTSIHQKKQDEEDDIQEVVPVKSEPGDQSSNLYQSPPEQHISDHTLATYHEEEAVYDEYGVDQYETLDQQYAANSSMTGLVDQSKDIEVKKPEDLLRLVVSGVGGAMCALCTKSFKNKRDARNHVESIHYPNSFVYTCEYCGKEFNALNTKNVHVTRHHSKKTPTGYLL